MMTERSDNIAPTTYPATAYKSVRYKGTPPPAVADGGAVTEGEVRIEVVGLVVLVMLVVVLLVLVVVLVTVLMESDDDKQGQ
jgi:heme/copper-type cytochrome/quinol oxidase subunit 2